MKKLLCTCLTVCLLTGAALADVLWEPDDDFYQKHYQDCEVLGRSYYTNGQAGFVMVFDTPRAKNYVEPHLENGISLWVSFTYTDSDGDAWGVVELEDGRTGWVAMAALTLIYDEQSFREEHQSEFVPYDGSFEELCTSEDQRVIIWTYPGSGVVDVDFEHLSQDYSPLLPEETWTDGEGRVWGRIGYYMGSRGWVCLSEPDSEDLPVTEHVCDLYPTGDLAQVEQAAAQKADQTLWFLGGGVALVCGVTAFLILRMKKPK